jgi:hypothetical protein
MDKFARGDTVTWEVAISELSASLVTLTVNFVGDDTLGAVNRPVRVMVPPLTCHTTAVLLVEVSVAENWTRPPEATSALVGTKFIWTAGFLVDELGDADDMPAHPRFMHVATVRRKMARQRKSC